MKSGYYMDNFRAAGTYEDWSSPCFWDYKGKTWVINYQNTDQGNQVQLTYVRLEVSPLGWRMEIPLRTTPSLFRAPAPENNNYVQTKYA